ncbi:MFS transporter [Kitasatospora phosalacinea]|uniref:MFS transporter n=1 Tax=Kitasatospora phosalacinea TaxID=2065 RepID=UPI003659CA6C
MPLTLYVLAVAVFAMGTSEFLPAGLLPEIAAGLDVSVGAAGALASAFALGMVAGAPLMAAWARRWPRRAGLSGFVAVFAAAHAVGAVTGSFAVLFASRAVAALANAGFLALAVATAAALVAPERKGRAVGVLLGVPAGAGASGAPSLRTELAQLARLGLWLTLLLAALVNAGTFGAFTFLAPVVTGPAGLGRGWVPVVLVLFGAGTFLGVSAAGRLADTRSGRLLCVGGPLLLLGWPALAVCAGRPALLLPLVLLLGALSFAVGAMLVTRALYEGAGAPTMAGGYATAALNLGAAAGPLLAATTLPSATGPLWTAAVLVGSALLLGAVGLARGRLRARA